MSEFDDFMAWLHGVIRKDLAENGHCKSYEGTVRAELETPSVFEPYEVKLTLHMYVIAPVGRKHTWRGKSLGECVAKARLEIQGWLAQGALEEVRCV